MKKKLALFLALLLLATTFTGCGSDSSDAQGADAQGGDTQGGSNETVIDDELVILSSLANESFDPFGNATIEQNCIFAVYDTLVKPIDGKTFKPGLAESWEEVDDGLAMVFKIREDAVFHDGTPVTGEDVYFSWSTMFDSPLGTYLKRSLTGIELISPYEIKITKVAPYVNLLQMATVYGPVVSKAAYEADLDAFNQNPIGSGPYKFTGYAEDRSATFEANKEYWDGAPDFETLIVKAPLDMATAIIGLENGEIDFMGNIPNSQLSILEGNSDVTVQEIDFVTNTVALSMMDEIFLNDIELRKAVYHAVNDENVIIAATDGFGFNNGELVPDLVLGDYKGYVDSAPIKDVELAKEALAKSNYNGEEIIFHIMGGDDLLAQTLQSDLSTVGINVKIEVLDPNDYYGRLNNKELDFTTVWLGADPDSYESVLATFTTESNSRSGSRGHIKPEWDEWMNTIKTTTDEEERKETVKMMSDDIIASYNVVPLYSGTSNFAFRSHLEYGVSAVSNRPHEITLKK